MKTLRAAPLAALALCIAHGAYADNRLFPTDMLDQGEYDAHFTFDHQDQSRDATFNANTGTQHSDLNSEQVGLRYGLNNDWLIGLDLTYNSLSNTQTDYTSPTIQHFSNTSGQDGQNPDIWVKYGILDDEHSPFTLSAQFLVSPHVGDNVATAYRGLIAAGWRMDDTLRLYGTLYHNINTSDATPDRTEISVGAYKDFSENFTLIPHASVSELQSTPTSTSYSQYGFGMSSDIQFARNTYLIPDISYFSNAASHDPSDAFRGSPSHGKDISIELYHLF